MTYQHEWEEKEEELREVISEAKDRIAALEAENAALREAAQIASQLESLINTQSPPNYREDSTPTTPIERLRWIVDRCAALRERVNELQWQKEQIEGREAVLHEAIEEHAAMGHERCHENDKALYAAAGIAQDCTLPPKEQWMHDCERYWECRKSGIAEWPSVTQLQSEIGALREDKARLDWLGETDGVKAVGLGRGPWIVYRYPLHKQQRFTSIRKAIDAARKEA